MVENSKKIPLTTVMHTIMVSKDLLHELLNKKGIEIIYNDSGKECIKDSEFKKLCYSKEAKQLSVASILNSLCFLEEETKSGKNHYYSEKIEELLKKYSKDISILENLHDKYKNKIDILKEETGLSAAYILYAKVINLLNMTCVCLREHYFNAGSLLRIIDETIDLAEYFIISESEDNGIRDLKRWFREDVSPKHKTCREVVSKYINEILSQTDNEELMYEIYQKKSKMIHPTRNIIIKSGFLFYKNTNNMSLQFDYKSTRYLRQIYELTAFFKSSIWTSIQGFFICFYKKMPLEQIDKNMLIKLNDKYEKMTKS